MATLPLAALAADKDPPVPPGRDPGGVAIAIIGPGIDYTWSEISKHLARDGEGEIIGWDFADNDRRPFEHRKNNADNPYTSAQWVVLKIIDKAPNTRIVPLRVGEPNALQLGRAATYVGQSPAKIALVMPTSERAEDWQLFRKAAEHFPDVLFIASPYEPCVEIDPPLRNVDISPVFPISFGLDNLLSVTDFDDQHLPFAHGGFGPLTIDVAIQSNKTTSIFITHDGPKGSIVVAGDASQISVAALAARIVAKEPELKGKALKARILRLATPLPADTDPISKHGLIAEPWKLYPAH